MQRACVCGKLIAGRKHLCDECLAIYGNRSEWPAWLLFWVNDTERERKQDERVSEHEISYREAGIDSKIGA